MNITKCRINSQKKINKIPNKGYVTVMLRGSWIISMLSVIIVDVDFIFTCKVELL